MYQLKKYSDTKQKQYKQHCRNRTTLNSEFNDYNNIMFIQTRWHSHTHPLPIMLPPLLWNTLGMREQVFFLHSHKFSLFPWTTEKSFSNENIKWHINATCLICVAKSGWCILNVFWIMLRKWQKWPKYLFPWQMKKLFSTECLLIAKGTSRLLS